MSRIDRNIERVLIKLEPEKKVNFWIVLYHLIACGSMLWVFMEIMNEINNRIN